MPKLERLRINFTSKNMFEMVFLIKLYVITLCMSCIKSYLALLRDLSIFLERVLTPTWGVRNDTNSWAQFAF